MNTLLLIPCIFKHFFGFDCPGCGIQRSFILLIKGDITASFFMYPALIPILLSIIYYIVKYHLLKKNNQTDLILLSLIGFSALLIAINYSIKIINGNI